MTTGTMTREDTGSFAPVRLAHRPAVAPMSSGNPLAGWVPPSSWADEPTPLYDGVYPDQDHRDYTRADGVIRAAAKAERDQAALLAAFIDERAAWAAAEMRQIVEPLDAEQRQQHAATTYGHLPPAPARELTPEALDAEHQQRQAEQQPVIHVDFNAQARGGQIKASIRQASRPIEIGQTVRAVDPHEDDMACDAVVRSIEGACVYLEPLLNSHAGLAALSQRRGVDYTEQSAPSTEAPGAVAGPQGATRVGHREVGHARELPGVRSTATTEDTAQPEPRHLLRAELRALRDDLRRAWTELRAWRPWKRGEQ